MRQDVNCLRMIWIEYQRVGIINRQFSNIIWISIKHILLILFMKLQKEITIEFLLPFVFVFFFTFWFIFTFCHRFMILSIKCLCVLFLFFKTKKKHKNIRYLLSIHVELFTMSKFCMFFFYNVAILRNLFCL